MSEPSRRGFIGSAATAASLVGLNAAAEQDFPFKNNLPDPMLSGKELPTFKFELEKSHGRVIDGGFGKEATVEQLPISKGIAGVSMKLEPGAMRELHWHATAAEWAFVIEGRTRTTVIDPQGNAETNDFEPGDVLATNFGKPAALFKKFPQNDVFISSMDVLEGPCLIGGGMNLS